MGYQDWPPVSRLGFTTEILPTDTIYVVKRNEDPVTGKQMTGTAFLAWLSAQGIGGGGGSEGTRFVEIGDDVALPTDGMVVFLADGNPREFVLPESLPVNSKVAVAHVSFGGAPDTLSVVGEANTIFMYGEFGSVQSVDIPFGSSWVEFKKIEEGVFGEETYHIWVVGGAATGGASGPQPYENTPSAPSEFGSSGNSNQYAKGDHSHPEAPQLLAHSRFDIGYLTYGSQLNPTFGTLYASALVRGKQDVPGGTVQSGLGVIFGSYNIYQALGGWFIGVDDNQFVFGIGSEVDGNYLQNPPGTADLSDYRGRFNGRLFLLSIYYYAGTVWATVNGNIVWTSSWFDTWNPAANASISPMIGRNFNNGVPTYLAGKLEVLGVGYADGSMPYSPDPYQHYRSCVRAGNLVSSGDNEDGSITRPFLTKMWTPPVSVGGDWVDSLGGPAFVSSGPRLTSRMPVLW